MARQTCPHAYPQPVPDLWTQFVDRVVAKTATPSDPWMCLTSNNRRSEDFA